MVKNVFTIPLANLALMIIPITIVGTLYFRWTQNYLTIVNATVRMILQLLGIGFIGFVAYSSKFQILIL